MLFLASPCMLTAQTIRGTVIDAVTGEAIPYASVTVSPGKGAITDTLGRFRITNLPIKRYSVKASYVGYEPSVFEEILVSSAKETVLDFKLKEVSKTLNTVVVKPKLSKEAPLNNMALVGAKMLSVEEASRYAGGFNDPARLAASFAGVSTDGADNGISIHGNSPHLLQWRLEGIEIPTPNHFNDIYTVGNGLISALSAQVMNNSDFLSTAYPAEFGNALSGVFDISLRNGNNQKNENTLQFGTLGLEAASEGPLNKHGASYIFNYRYSFLGLLDKLGIYKQDTGDVLNYQDLNLKLNFPTKKSGTFSLFALGYADRAYTHIDSPDTWETLADQENYDAKLYNGLIGLTHKYHFNGKGTLTNTISTTYNKASVNDYYTEQYSDATKGTYVTTYFDLRQRTNTYTWNTAYYRRFGTKFVYKTGFTLTHHAFSMKMNLADYIGASTLNPLYDTNNSTNQISAYSSSVWDISPRTSLSFGLFGQYLSLNKDFVIEPRASLRMRVGNKGTFSFGYGLHSRMEKMDVLFVKDAKGNLANRDLGFTKAHHLMLSYSHKINDNLNFKAEAYYQYLFNVPVGEGKDASYSVLNRNDNYIDKTLINKGKGRNYGIDFSLEKYLTKGFYYVLNTSLFKSEYRGSDKVWHNTRYDREWMVKALGGKEWYLGKNGKNVLTASIKVTYQGGLRHSPTDLTATLAEPDKQVQYDETKAFSIQFDPDLLIDFTLLYKVNCRRTSHEFGVKWLNITDNKVFLDYDYNFKSKSIEPKSMGYSFPDICYKLYF